VHNVDVPNAMYRDIYPKYCQKLDLTTDAEYGANLVSVQNSPYVVVNVLHFDTFWSTPPSRPNIIGGMSVSIVTSVRPSTKSFFRFQ